MAGADRLSAAREALAAAEASASASGLRPADATSVRSSTEPDPHAVARKIVLRQLAMGPRTRRQLEDKLADRDCDPQVAARVLDRMAEVGLVDDEAYAEMYVRSKQETKGLAAGALRQELRRKGVAEEVVDSALDDINPEHEREQARALVRRRLRTMQGLEREVQTRRLAGFLARKGYSPGVSYQVIRDALDGLPEHQRD
ncbi:Regulatory protein RecX [Serinicoccus hydrothermalis]|uniref:Regulatory protein RecX n=1 Tax=Serinicoccus hydrothermalis TaxID=1758689 RepID=A0A1B1NGK4_9MICO|nr:regulatory protein RecX [Serinicoccus hydrothermalis]ANS80554.1 Regulatory protein RecX [Serinicoccus hydrothermalis]